MKRNQLNDRFFSWKQQGRKIKEGNVNSRNKGGPVYPAKDVITTVRGQRLHIRLIPGIDVDDANAVSDLNRPIIAICGAGAPNVEFPLGSGIEPEMMKQENPDQVVHVDCYKCIKLAYLNQMKENGLDVPVREFECSDQKPTYSSYGDEITIKELSDIDPETISSIKNIENVFVLYFKTSEEMLLGKVKRYKKVKGKYKPKKKKRIHIRVKSEDIQPYTEYFTDQGFAVRVEPPAKEGSYDRRESEAPSHLMIPMGRYGVFGGWDKKQIDKLRGKEGFDLRIEKNGRKGIPAGGIYGAMSDVYDGESGERKGNLTWVEQYFNTKKNKWKVGRSENEHGQKRRTQQDSEAQKKKNKDRLFELVALDIINYEPAIQATVKEEAVYAEVVKMLKEYKDLLEVIPMNIFWGTFEGVPFGDPLYEIYKSVRDLRITEYKAYSKEMNLMERKREERLRIAKLIDDTATAIREGADNLPEDMQEDIEYPMTKKKSRVLARRWLRSEGLIPDKKVKKKVKMKDQTFDFTEDMETKENPVSNRVLPLLDRLEELDTMIIELESRYAKNRRRR